MALSSGATTLSSRGTTSSSIVLPDIGRCHTARQGVCGRRGHPPPHDLEGVRCTLLPHQRYPAIGSSRGVRARCRQSPGRRTPCRRSRTPCPRCVCPRPMPPYRMRDDNGSGSSGAGGSSSAFTVPLNFGDPFSTRH